jgi:glutamine synthetase
MLRRRSLCSVKPAAFVANDIVRSNRQTSRARQLFIQRPSAGIVGRNKILLVFLKFEQGNDEVTPKEVLAFCREKDVKAVDLRFTDFPGLCQHTTIPVTHLNEDVFEDGLGFDGSSIRGWQAINESDMLIVPQPDTAFLDPFTALPTLVMICNIQDPITREDYSRDPRNVARKATNYLKTTGIADTVFIGPEAEFFIFDDVRFDQRSNEGYYHLDSIEGEWNRGRKEGPNLA